MREEGEDYSIEDKSRKLQVVDRVILYSWVVLIVEV